MIEQLSGLPAHTFGVKLSGKLHDADYKTLVPLVDAEIAKEGKINILAQFHDFHGWDAKALWDDTKFSTTHCGKIRRVAIRKRDEEAAKVESKEHDKHDGLI